MAEVRKKTGLRAVCCHLNCIIIYYFNGSAGGAVLGNLRGFLTKLQRCFYVGGLHLLAIVELHALFQLEHPFGIAYDLIGFHKTRLGLQVLVCIEQAVVGHLVDIVSGHCVVQVCGNTGCLIGSRNDQSILGGTSLGLGFLVLRGCCGSGSFCFLRSASLGRICGSLFGATACKQGCCR